MPSRLTSLLLELRRHHHVHSLVLIETRPLHEFVVPERRVPVRRASPGLAIRARDSEPERLPLALLTWTRRQRWRSGAAFAGARVREAESRVHADVLLVGSLVRRRVRRVTRGVPRTWTGWRRRLLLAARRSTDADPWASVVDRGVGRAPMVLGGSANRQDGRSGTVTRTDRRHRRTRAMRVLARTGASAKGKVEPREEGRRNGRADFALVVLGVFETRVVAVSVGSGRTAASAAVTLAGAIGVASPHRRRRRRRRNDRRCRVEEAGHIRPGRRHCRQRRARRERVAERNRLELTDNVVEELLHRRVARLRDVNRQDRRAIRRPLRGRVAVEGGGGRRRRGRRQTLPCGGVAVGRGATGRSESYPCLGRGFLELNLRHAVRRGSGLRRAGRDRERPRRSLARRSRSRSGRAGSRGRCRRRPWSWRGRRSAHSRRGCRLCSCCRGCSSDSRHVGDRAAGAPGSRSDCASSDDMLLLLGCCCRDHRCCQSGALIQARDQSHLRVVEEAASESPLLPC